MADIITEFIPTIWSANILEDKKKTHVFGALANRTYEGEIRAAGDQVRIPQVGHTTVNDYTRNNQGTGLTLENINVASMALTIDQEKYVNVYIDQVDSIQSKPEFITDLRKNIAYDLGDAQDTFFSGLYAQAGLSSTSNSATSFVTIGSSNVKTELLLLGKVFDAANIPMEGRWLTIPPSLKFELVDAGILEQSNNDRAWENGNVGKAYGWNLIMTNNLSIPSTDTDQVRMIAGVGNESVTLAEQIVDMKMADAFQAQKGFGVILGGLHVYGGRLIPDRTGVLYAKVSNS